MSFELHTEHELLELDDMAGAWSDSNRKQPDNGEAEPLIRNIADLKPMESFGDSEIRWLVDDFVAESTISVITSAPGDGKTTLTAELGYRVSRGEPFAGRLTSKRPVLILDRENSRTGLMAVFERLGIHEHEDFHVWGGWHPEDAPAPDAGLILDWILGCNPKPLIIPDSLVAFSGASENDATETRAFFHRCRKLASLGATVIFPHHIGKSETAKQYRGSSDIPAAIDLGILLSNHSDTPGRLDRLILTPFKDRLGHFRQTVFRYTATGFVEEHFASESNTEKLIRLLKANPGITKSGFRDLAREESLGRNRAEAFLESYARKGNLRVEDGPRKARLFSWIEAQHEAQNEAQNHGLF
jgi:hypothetical protein